LFFLLGDFDVRPSLLVKRNVTFGLLCIDWVLSVDVDVRLPLLVKRDVAFEPRFFDLELSAVDFNFDGNRVTAEGIFSLALAEP
jgi:hypothetical protein